MSSHFSLNLRKFARKTASAALARVQGHFAGRHPEAVTDNTLESSGKFIVLLRFHIMVRMSNTLGKMLICLGDLPVPHPQGIRKSPCRAHHQVFTDTTKFSWSSPVISVQARLTCQASLTTSTSFVAQLSVVR